MSSHDAVTRPGPTADEALCAAAHRWQPGCRVRPSTPAGRETPTEVAERRGPPSSVAVQLEQRVLLSVLSAVRNGDFGVRMPLDWTGVEGKIADCLNEVIATNQGLEAELARVSRVVGKEASSPSASRRGGRTASGPGASTP